MDWGIFWTTIGTGIGIISIIYAILRDFRKDVNERFEKIDQRFVAVDQRFAAIDQRLNSMDTRLSHLEGAFEERGRETKIIVLKGDQVEGK